MILCLNLNAAIDKTIVVSSFRINQIHRPESVVALAGGKGCNVARALKTLGETPVVSGWVGGFAGQFIEKELHQEGIQTAFIHTDFESRTCTSILDRTKQTMTEIYELGEPVPLEKIDALREYISANIGKYQAITLSGSLPPGVPSDFYADLIKVARDENVLTFLDTSGDALHKGIKAGPFLIKPNETEARSLLGLAPEKPFDFAEAATKISIKYGTHVLLSLGAKGAVAARAKELFIVKNPYVDAKSAVGSGDCMLAGFVHGFLQGLSFEKAVICGVATGAANTLVIGAGQFKLDDFERLRGQVYLSGKARYS
jgi:tagatose 6-phosphate kinase